jgi:hypothetical protein
MTESRLTINLYPQNSFLAQDPANCKGSIGSASTNTSFCEEVGIDAITVKNNLRNNILSFVNMKKHDYIQSFDLVNKHEQIIKKLTVSNSKIANILDSKYLELLKHNNKKTAEISTSLKNSGLSAAELFSSTLYKLKTASEAIKSTVSTSYNNAFTEFNESNTRIQIVKTDLEELQVSATNITSSLNNVEFDQVNSQEYDDNIAQLRQQQTNCKLPQPPMWISYFGTWAFNLYSRLQTWIWERHGVGKQYREITTKIEQLENLHNRFVTLTQKLVTLNANITKLKKELDELNNGFNDLKTKSEELAHLNQCIELAFNEEIYQPFANMFDFATIKQGQATDSKQKVQNNNIQEFSNIMKKFEPKNIELLSANAGIIEKAATKLCDAFEAVNKQILSTRYKQFLSNEDIIKIEFYTSASNSFLIFATAITDFAKAVAVDCRKLFTDSLSMETKIQEFTKAKSEIEICTKIDTLLLQEQDDKEKFYIDLYKVMPAEFRNNYIKERYLTEVTNNSELSVHSFVEIVKDVYKLKPQDCENMIVLLQEHNPVSSYFI